MRVFIGCGSHGLKAARQNFVYVEHCQQKDPKWVMITVLLTQDDKFVHQLRAPYSYLTKYLEEIKEL